MMKNFGILVKISVIDVISKLQKFYKHLAALIIWHTVEANNWQNT